MELRKDTESYRVPLTHVGKSIVHKMDKHKKTEGTDGERESDGAGRKR